MSESDDAPAGPRWGLANAARSALVLERARRQLADGDPEGAVVYAEELLEDNPADVDALLLIADAAPRYGHGEVGVLAARQARSLGRDPGVLEAAALLAACDVEAALAAADHLLDLAPAEARAWAIRAQALEVLERFPEADLALARAHALRPESYPRPARLDARAWEAAIRDALSMLDGPDREIIGRWRVEIGEAPTLEELRSVRPHAPPATRALLVRTPAGPVLRAYRRPLARGADDADEVAMRLAEAIRYELEVFEG
ncbi:MAG: hypothetical protein FJ090_14290 [Deltaproteobacteria bacterium]|nr:hypothetical protein [Deltaproteobacteria bacterium]